MGMLPQTVVEYLVGLAMYEACVLPSIIRRWHSLGRRTRMPWNIKPTQEEYECMAQYEFRAAFYVDRDPLPRAEVRK